MSTFVEIQSAKQQQMLNDALTQQHQQNVAEVDTQAMSDTADAFSNSQT